MRSLAVNTLIRTLSKAPSVSVLTAPRFKKLN